jgi:hypothetical protein
VNPNLSFLQVNVRFLIPSVVDPQHVDADPDADQDSTFHHDADVDADPDSDFLFDADLDPTFHPDPDPNPSILKKGSNSRKNAKYAHIPYILA